MNLVLVLTTELELASLISCASPVLCACQLAVLDSDPRLIEDKAYWINLQRRYSESIFLYDLYIQHVFFFYFREINMAEDDIAILLLTAISEMQESRRQAEVLMRHNQQLVDQNNQLADKMKELVATKQRKQLSKVQVSVQTKVLRLCVLILIGYR